MAVTTSMLKPPRRRATAIRLAAGLLLVATLAMTPAAHAANLRFDRAPGAGDGLQYTQKLDPCAPGGRHRGQDAGQDPECPDSAFSQQQPHRDGPRHPGPNAFGLQFDYEQN